LTKRHVCNSHFLAEHYGNVRAAHALILEREDAANGPITLVTVYPLNSM
jgi:hypothetical protein